MKKNMIAQLGLVLFLSAAALSAPAAPLKIATIDVAPFGFTGPDGKITGIWYEIGNLIAQEAGLQSDNVLMPYARTVKALEDGDVSFVVRFSNEELDKNAIVVAPVVTLSTIVLGPKGSNYKQISDLHGKTIGILRGGKYTDAFSNDAQIKKFEANDYAQEINMLAALRLDGAAGTAIGLYYEASRKGLSKDQVGEPLLLGSQDIYLIFSKKNADDKTIAAVKAATEKLQKEGAFAKIISKYLGEFKSAMGEIKQ